MGDSPVDQTEADRAATRKWLQGGARKFGSPNAAADPSNDPSLMSQIGSAAYQTGRGALKGAYSNVAGLETAASKATGIKGLAPWQSSQDWLNKEDESGWETAGRIGGEYGSLMIPGLDAPAGAGLATRLGVDALKGAVGGMAGTGDPKEGATAGAATAGGSTLARTLGHAALNRVPAPLRYLGDKALTIGGVMAAENALHGAGRGTYVPSWYIGHSLPSALAALAAIAMGAPPAAQGRAGAELYKGDDESQ